ncbi:hypothetical protein LW649_002868 [Salmonella enterica]|nr:hypothetical protein [Salmonella enterica]
MGNKDSNYQIVYRGEGLKNFIPGGWVFFQRPKIVAGVIGWGEPMRIVSGLSWSFQFR